MSTRKNKRNQAREQEKIRAMDRRWFECNPSRNFQLRLAMASELEIYQASHIIVRKMGKDVHLRIGITPTSLPKVRLDQVPDEQMAVLWRLQELRYPRLDAFVQKLTKIVAEADAEGN